MNYRLKTLLSAGLLTLATAPVWADGGTTCAAGATENHAITATTPTADFTDNPDSTVIDKQTGLMWAKCSRGLSGNDCTTGTVFTGNWQQALAQAEIANGANYLGHTDWRLPNINELESIVERRCDSPSVNAVIFPATQSATYWSSSPYAVSADGAWFVNFVDGRVSAVSKHILNRVRLVRAGQ